MGRQRRKQAASSTEGPVVVSVGEKLLLTVAEAAGLMSVSRRYLYARVSAGKIYSVKEGRRRLIPRRALDEYLRGIPAA